MCGVACFSLQDVKTEGCRVLCIRDGYTTGSFANEKCQCTDEKKYEDFVTHSINIENLPLNQRMTAEDKAMGMVAPFVERKQMGNWGSDAVKVEEPEEESVEPFTFHY